MVTPEFQCFSAPSIRRINTRNYRVEWANTDLVCIYSSHVDSSQRPSNIVEMPKQTLSEKSRVHTTVAFSSAAAEQSILHRPLCDHHPECLLDREEFPELSSVRIIGFEVCSITPTRTVDGHPDAETDLRRYRDLSLRVNSTVYSVKWMRSFP